MQQQLSRYRHLTLFTAPEIMIVGLTHWIIMPLKLRISVQVCNVILQRHVIIVIFICFVCCPGTFTGLEYCQFYFILWFNVCMLIVCNAQGDITRSHNEIILSVLFFDFFMVNHPVVLTSFSRSFRGHLLVEICVHSNIFILRNFKMKLSVVCDINSIFSTMYAVINAFLCITITFSLVFFKVMDLPVYSLVIFYPEYL